VTVISHFLSGKWSKSTKNRKDDFFAFYFKYTFLQYGHSVFEGYNAVPSGFTKDLYYLKRKHAGANPSELQRKHCKNLQCHEYIT
jgi:hypothetical protein